MISRLIEKELLDLLTFFPAVGIIGPRQSGKTTLAKILSGKIDKDCIYLDLESPTDRNKLNEPEYFFNDNKEKCIILDEIQRMSWLFSILRSVIDKHKVPGRFIILGSASPAIMRDSSESLAGRIAYKELSPFNITEIGFDYFRKHWLVGGFPEAFKYSDHNRSRQWLENFITTYIERDLRIIGLEASPTIIGNFWKMLAYSHGNVFNASTFARSLGISSPTITRYLHYLKEAFMIQSLQPYHFNTKKRLVKSPKIYIRDSGVFHYLVNTLDMNILPVHVLVGASWEGYVIEQIRQITERKSDLYYYRTHHGTECDLVFVRNMKPLAALEIKHSSAPSVTKGFTLSINDLGTENNFVITPDTDDYLLKKNIRVCRLEDFLTTYLSKIIS